MKRDHKVETIPVQEALGRINYRDIIAEKTLPDQSISMVNGIAVKLIYYDFLETEEWSEGYEYVFRKAGAEIPYGFDAVVPMKDYGFDTEGRLKIYQKPKHGKNIIPAGSLMHKGEIIAPVLTPLGQLELELLNACGITRIEVLTETDISKAILVRKKTCTDSLNIQEDRNLLTGKQHKSLGNTAASK